MSSTLYIVATPIGNMEDITLRAIQVLKSVDFIAAEDTRQSGKLMQAHQIETPLTAVHNHNEELRIGYLINQLKQGKDIALISDAGTPLISDPGFKLVRAAHEANIRVVPVPGACAAITALSASGLASDRFSFEGFLPAKSVARRKVLEGLVKETQTLMFYEAPHRIIESLTDMKEIFGETRLATIGRELTKTFETIKKMTLGELLEFVSNDPNQQKGEIVLIIDGASDDASDQEQLKAEALLIRLLQDLPVKTASQLASDLTGIKKNELYKRALALQAEQEK